MERELDLLDAQGCQNLHLVIVICPSIALHPWRHAHLYELTFHQPQLVLVAITCECHC